MNLSWNMDLAEELNRELVIEQQDAVTTNNGMEPHSRFCRFPGKLRGRLAQVSMVYSLPSLLSPKLK